MTTDWFCEAGMKTRVLLPKYCCLLAAATCKPSTWAVRIKSSEKVASLKDLLTKLREDPSAKEVQGTDGGWDAA
jgi:tripartite-type tricarboxylate transporter receptor subunit TctC